MGKYLLGIDVGTTNVKGVLFNLNGEIVAQKQSEYSTFFPSRGWAEQDPECWWDAVAKIIRYIIDKSSVENKEIIAIGVSCQAPTMLPVDKKGKPLRNALIWMDRRAEEQCRMLKEEIGEDKIFSITGNRIDTFFVLPELLWFKTNEPHLYEETYKILQPNGYINYKLTGQFTIDTVHASITQFYDINEKKWSGYICNKLNISTDIFPDVYESTIIIGSVSREAALITGLAAGTAVIAGTVDGAAAALEAGITGTGQAVEMTGTSSVLLIGSNELKTNKNLTAMFHAISNRYLILGTMSSTGASLKWFRDQFGFVEQNPGKETGLDAYEMMDLEVEHQTPGPGNIIFLPYMMGERSPIWNTFARGGFMGLTLNSKRGEMIKSIMEGAAFALYHNIEEAVKMGISFKELRAVGGGAKSKLWLKIKASVTNLPIVVPKTSVGAPFGDAILAGVGAGIYKDIDETVKEFVKIGQIIEPDSTWHSKYIETYNIYRGIYEHTKDDLYSLSNINLER